MWYYARPVVQQQGAIISRHQGKNITTSCPSSTFFHLALNAALRRILTGARGHLAANVCPSKPGFTVQPPSVSKSLNA